MPRITIELLRKRSEHNEGEISTLEELSLHQENIEKIEFLNQACRHLKILLMQNNLISKIENLHKLKQLEYLNLALNNIEVIENLEGLESLKKLDLTVNFIGDLRGVETLRNNENLEILILTGNPCCDYDGYRDYVLGTLPQLRELDMKAIERSERIKALQRLAEATGDVIRAHRKYAKQREAQKVRYRKEEDEEEERKKLRATITEVNDDGEEVKSTKEANNSDDDDDDTKFWKSKSYHTPEDRVRIAQKHMRQREKSERSSRDDESKRTKKRPLRLFHPDGRPYSVNRANVSFSFDDETDPDNCVLDIALYKHLDTSLVEVDVQPSYVRVTIKSKILQLALPYEVSTGKSSARRNTTTGHLLIIMPRLSAGPSVYLAKREEEEKGRKKGKKVTLRAEPEVSKRQYLEIGPPAEDLDEMLIVVNEDGTLRERKKLEEVVSDEEGFEDDPSVPPLERVF